MGEVHEFNILMFKTAGDSNSSVVNAGQGGSCYTKIKVRELCFEVSKVFKDVKFKFNFCHTGVLTGRHIYEGKC